MIKNRYIQGIWLTGLLFLWGCLVTGCSEQSEPDLQKGSLLQVNSMTRGDDEQQEMVVLPVPVGTSILMYLAYREEGMEAGKSESISGFVTYAGKNKNKDVWNSGVYVDVDQNYYVYGFMPSDLVNSSKIEPNLSGTTITGAKLVLNGVTALSDKDFNVIIGVRDGDVSEIVPGNFFYQATIGEDNLLKGISLLVDHLYASAKFTITINSEYNKLRTIKLKSMKLACPSQTMYCKPNVTITFTNGYRNPVTSVTTVQDTSEGADTRPAELTLFESAEGVELKVDESILDVTGNFLPAYANYLSLVTTYDVYDKEGNKIRENCQSSNQLVRIISNIGRGQRRPVALTVNPTYLYVLSDPDLDNPTLVVE